MDLSGLTKPLTKLVEVIANGIGALGRPHSIRKDSEAQAHKIHVLAEALEEIQHLPLNIEYKDENLQISLSDTSATGAFISDPISLENRTLGRLMMQEQKRQKNLEDIASEAARTLENEEEVSDDPVDDDWIARFFRIAEDVSTEEMQSLWGRILAGEVKQPGAYSLRALEVLRNLSQSDADMFACIAKIRVTTNTKDSFLINPENGNFLNSEFGISFSDLLHLRELGLLMASDMIAMQYEVQPKGRIVFRCGNRGLVVKAQEKVKLEMGIIALTSIGNQLAGLVPASAPDSYLKKLAGTLKTKGVTFQIADISHDTPTSVRVSNSTDIADI